VFHFLGDTKIRQLDLPVVIAQNVLGLDILETWLLACGNEVSVHCKVPCGNCARISSTPTPRKSGKQNQRVRAPELALSEMQC
jgi:hypothetical protein